MSVGGLDVEFLGDLHGDYRLFNAELIVVEDWVRWQCRYGCNSYGKFFSCPPYTPSVDETRELVGEYSHAVWMWFRDLDPNGEERSIDGHYFQEQIKGVHKTMLEAERKAFLSGYHKAFSFWGLPCGFCRECIIKEQDNGDGCVSKKYCRHPSKVRPTIEGSGINAFKTAENIGIDLEILLDPEDHATIYSILLLD
ncbi:DUF2284 domain-containing protein [Methanonatronarchaeum sp. AMET6-2]|uniref:DUF2284 domain-containing protein n=1 Tax=Methanonatronarchaeum sp. AMET6-2 TaxID=2933293 RepID=UPI001FF0E02F|nr:DUF2284 domain-containing protein [Methanonatronarchaeum sp. AMET6-2]UOY09624.1 DUF2284 domain-containing protein [Methanonatronarchaeum sp. AMET6-2]